MLRGITLKIFIVGRHYHTAIVDRSACMYNLFVYYFTYTHSLVVVFVLTSDFSGLVFYFGNSIGSVSEGESGFYTLRGFSLSPRSEFFVRVQKDSTLPHTIFGGRSRWVSQWVITHGGRFT